MDLPNLRVGVNNGFALLFDGRAFPLFLFAEFFVDLLLEPCGFGFSILRKLLFNRFCLSPVDQNAEMLSCLSALSEVVGSAFVRHRFTSFVAQYKYIM